MALEVPTSGAISMSLLASVYGLSPPYKLSDLRKGGSYVPNTPDNINVKSTTDNMNISSYRNSTIEYRITLTTNTTNYNLYNSFISLYTNLSVLKKIIKLNINSGVTIGSTTSTNPALIIDQFPSGTTITVINNGNIYGAGGTPGTGGNGTIGNTVGQTSTFGTLGTIGNNGGTAIFINTGSGRIINIYNSSTGNIYAGGGGGGGGVGGKNGYSQKEKYNSDGTTYWIQAGYSTAELPPCYNPARNPYGIIWQGDPDGVPTASYFGTGGTIYEKNENVNGVSKTVQYTFGTFVTRITGLYCIGNDYSKYADIYKVIRKVPINGGNGGTGASGRGYNNMSTSLISPLLGQTNGPTAKTTAGISGYTSIDATDGNSGGYGGDWGSDGEQAITNIRTQGGVAGAYIDRNGNADVYLYNNGILLTLTNNVVPNKILGTFN